MRNRIGIAAFWTLFLVVLFSCSRDYSFEGGGALPPAGGNGGNGGGGGNGGNNTRRCISCTYLPFCDSSEFTYLIDSTDTIPGTIHLLRDTTIGGTTFSQVSGFAAFNQGILYNCNNQEYRLALSLAQLGIPADSINAAIQPLLDSILPVPGATLNIPNTFYATILKANAATGAQWLDTLVTLNVPFTQGPFTINLRIYVGIEYTYLEKNVNRTVLSRSYPNVQHVQGKPKIGLATQLPIPLPLPLPTVDGQLDFYLAKDVGLIEMKASDSTGTLTSAKLLRYRL